ncbi:MAG: hypothetical protein ABIV94_08850 [Acidimicrobiales bacterium]
MPSPASYKGPHGPFEGMVGPESTEMTGPNGWSGSVAWGSARVVVGSGFERLLRQGIELRVGLHTGIVRQPRLGFTRRRRSVHVEVAEATWGWHYRGIGKNRFERPDKSSVAEWPRGGHAGRLVVDDAAAPLEVAVAVLTWFARLDLSCRPVRL